MRHQADSRSTRVHTELRTDRCPPMPATRLDMGDGALDEASALTTTRFLAEGEGHVLIVRRWADHGRLLRAAPSGVNTNEA